MQHQAANGKIMTQRIRHSYCHLSLPNNSNLLLQILLLNYTMYLSLTCSRKRLYDTTSLIILYALQTQIGRHFLYSPHQPQQMTQPDVVSEKNMNLNNNLCIPPYKIGNHTEVHQWPVCSTTMNVASLLCTTQKLYGAMIYMGA